MQCPQAIQPKTDLSDIDTFLLIISKLKSLHTSAQVPQPLHFSVFILILAVSLVLEVGIAIQLIISD